MNIKEIFNKTRIKLFLISFIISLISYILYVIPSYLNSAPCLGIGPSLGIFGAELALGNTLVVVFYDVKMFYNLGFLIYIVFYIILSFIVAYLPYKLWNSYLLDSKDNLVRLNSLYKVLKFLGITLLNSITYVGYFVLIFSPFLDENFKSYWFYIMLYGTKSVLNPNIFSASSFIIIFLNIFGFSFIFGLIVISVVRILNINVPRNPFLKFHVSDKIANFSLIIGILLPLLSSIIITILKVINTYINIFIIIISFIFIILFLLKEDKTKLSDENYLSTNFHNSLIEEIVLLFALFTIIITIIFNILSNFNLLKPIGGFEHAPVLIFLNLAILISFVPAIFFIWYFEKNITNPIESITIALKSYVKEGNLNKTSDELNNEYGRLANKENEIGFLSNSLIKMIHDLENHIENIKTMTSEKEKIKAELDIANRIQKSILPKESIENSYFNIYGVSRPAKEVGGDFFDYYQIDNDNIVIVIGDASGKGIPAALFAVITQSSIKQTTNYELDPSKILYSINNILCDNNIESMFITLWIGIYNYKTKKLTYSNAGHNPPLIEVNNKFNKLDVDPGLVLGLLEDMEFKKEEIKLEEGIFLYTDGATDAINQNNKIYGENRIINFLNKNNNINNQNSIDFTKKLLKELIDNIDEFSKDTEQFDDMTVVYLNINDEK